MTALSDVLTRKLRTAQTLSFPVKTGATVYPGALVALDLTTGSTSFGTALPYSAAAGQVLIGRAQPTPDPSNLGAVPITGNMAAAVPPEVTVSVQEEVFFAATVGGVAGSMADMGKLVYASDDNVLTVTRPAIGQPMGRIVKYRTATTFDVLRFTANEQALLALTGNGRELVNLGALAAVTAATGTVLSLQGKPGRFRVVSAYGFTSAALAGGTSITLTLSKAGTGFTAGGVISFTTDAVGTKQAATAITQDALAEFSESDELRVAAVVVGSYTAGGINVYALVDRIAAE